MNITVTKITLKPIGLENQIQDAIEGKSKETERAVITKKQQLAEHINSVVNINGKRVYAPRINGEYIEYCMQRGGTKYYYPIQYATIEITLDNTTDEQTRMIPITIRELAEKAFSLTVGNTIDFSCQVEEDYIWNISKIRKLDTDLIIWGIYGGGMSFMHDLTGDSDATELATFIERSLPSYTAGTVWIKPNKPSRVLTPGDLYELIQQEQTKGYKYLFIYRNEKAMLEALDGKIYAISDTDGTHLCDLLREDYLRMRDEVTIISKAEARADIPYVSDWVVAEESLRNEVLACRVAILFFEKQTQ